MLHMPAKERTGVSVSGGLKVSAIGRLVCFG